MTTSGGILFRFARKADFASLEPAPGSSENSESADLTRCTLNQVSTALTEDIRSSRCFAAGEDGRCETVRASL